MVDRLLGGAVGAMPRVRPSVERGCELRLAPLEFHAQKLREEVMEAVPLAAVVEGDQEQVGPRESVEHPGCVLALQYGAAKRAAQPIEDRGSKHQLLHGRVVRLEYLLHQELD